MIKIVLDTNVLVSAILTPNGNAAKIVSMIVKNEILLCFDYRIKDEYLEVLGRKKFNFDQDNIDLLLKDLKKDAEVIIALPCNVNNMPDIKDLPFYEVATTARADYLITGNKIHFPKLDWIINPAEFLEKLDN